jgi:hypothetical protein
MRIVAEAGTLTIHLHLGRTQYEDVIHPAIVQKRGSRSRMRTAVGWYENLHSTLDSQAALEMMPAC